MFILLADFITFLKKDYNYFPNKECQVPFIPKEIKKYNQSLYLLLNSSCKFFYSDTSKHSPVYLQHFIMGKISDSQPYVSFRTTGKDLKNQESGPTPRGSDLVGVGWDLSPIPHQLKVCRMF